MACDSDYLRNSRQCAQDMEGPVKHLKFVYQILSSVVVALESIIAWRRRK